MKPIKYIQYKNVEYGFFDDDGFLQIAVKDMDAWKAKNRDQYMRLIRLIDGELPKSVRVDYVEPNKVVPRITVKINKMANLPFHEKALERLAKKVADLL